jgi:predicted pyridoxine 5'-phosphate oxidase superfamily flavin-nucleotide-binding protein
MGLLAMNEIRTVEELETCHGVASLPTRLKIIDYLDDGAHAWLKASPFAIVACDQGRRGFSLTCVGDEPGFVERAGERELKIPRRAIDDGALPSVGRAIATLFFVPGIGETLRVNGVVARASEDEVHISVNECFIHCGKALIRSDFWKPAGASRVANDLSSQLRSARFCALATIDAAGRADLSPKGDPSGFLGRLPDGGIVLPDRPGNRLADGFHNILANPSIAFLAMTPGSDIVTVVSGTARISREPSLLEPLAVDGHAPKLATLIEPSSMVVMESRALARSELWLQPSAKGTLDPSAILVAHIKLNKTAGDTADRIRAGVSTSVVQESLVRDYRENLY